ncbi:MAG: hypothetical protein HQ513_11605 [Rhodospirillales bacterium]|nr:hypothetical protein [Rhodospirillales bacterium]
MSKFEAAVYNKDVRECVKQGDSHELYEDSWSDTSYVETNAPDEETARARISQKYPSSRGFVIEYISLVTPD